MTFFFYTNFFRMPMSTLFGMWILNKVYHLKVSSPRSFTDWKMCLIYPTKNWHYHLNKYLNKKYSSGWRSLNMHFSFSQNAKSFGLLIFFSFSLIALKLISVIKLYCTFIRERERRDLRCSVCRKQSKKINCH